MVPAFLLSLLKQQWAAMGDGFATRHSHPWLVWEPGVWTAPAANKQTLDLSHLKLGSPTQGDALSFGLIAVGGKSPVLRIGRDGANDIVINDGTVSRQHAILKFQPPEDWLLEPVENLKAVTKVGSAEVHAGLPSTLRSKDEVRLGKVALTYYEFSDFLDRLRRQ